MRPHPVFLYGLAVIAVGVATLIRAAFEPILEDRGPFVFMFLAVAVAGWYGGFGPALFATALSSFLGLFLFIQPFMKFEASGTDWVFTGFFVAGGVGIAILSESMHRARERAEIIAAELSAEIAERERVARELEASISAEKAARTEAEIANRAKDEFLATVSHELRTPLNSMLGWSQILQFGTLEGDESRKALGIIERNAKHQAKLIDDVLDVSRIVTGKVRLEVKPVRLTPVIQQAIEVVRPTAEARQIEIVFNAEPGLDEVAGDPSRLQQVVWNLLSNAIKFTPTRGRVEARLEADGSHVVLVVRDNGEGIPREFLPYVFDRFRQAIATADRPHGGLGLGLAIVRHLVELHGGTVEARSDGEGKGATFIVRIPALTATFEDSTEGLGNTESEQIASTSFTVNAQK